MITCQSNWEDGESNRRVELQVAYELNAGHVAIDSVTPTRVHFCDPSTGDAIRSIGVWTDKGRSLLASQADAAGWTKSLAAKIESGEVHDILHLEPAGEAAEVEPAMKA